MTARDPGVDAYISALPPERAAVIEELRELIHGWVEGTRESMLYRMPAFSTADVYCTLAAQKRHYAIYVCKPALIEAHRAAPEGLDCGKGCVRFRSPDDLPREAIAALLRAAAAEPGWAH